MVTSYKDDFPIIHSSPSVPASERCLNLQMHQILEKAASKIMHIAPTTKHITFHIWQQLVQTKQTHAHQRYPCPLHKALKIHGVTFDTHLFFTSHINSGASRAAPGLSMLVAHAGPPRSFQKESISATYKTFIQSCLHRMVLQCQQYRYAQTPADSEPGTSYLYLFREELSTRAPPFRNRRTTG